MTSHTGEFPTGDWAGPTSELDRADDLPGQYREWEQAQQAAQIIQEPQGEQL